MLKGIKFSLIIFIFIFLSNGASLVSQERNSIYIPYMMSELPDPLNIQWSGDWVVASHMWVGLVDISEKGNPLPRLAKSWKNSEDGLIWEFSIHENLKWSDGNIMTLEQICRSLQISKEGTSHSDLSVSIRSISKLNNNIIFQLNHPIPNLLIYLSYIDWAILHPDTIQKMDKKYSLQKANPCSGPFCLKENKNLTNNIAVSQHLLKKNENYKLSQVLPLENIEINYFDKCEMLVNEADKILSFRSYSQTFNDECLKKMKSLGFEVFKSQPTWIMKADFTSSAINKIPLEIRQSLLLQIQKLLHSEKIDFGVSNATGLRPSHLFGSLTESEMSDYLNELEMKLLKSNSAIKNLNLKLVTMDLWGSWKSFQWFKDSLIKLGINLEVTILSKADFFSSSEKIQKDYDLKFMPLGIGDPDPDSTWRIASKYVYPNILDNQKIQEAFFERNKNKREFLYKELTMSLLSSGSFIPLRMDSDFIGVHNSVKIGDTPPFRLGVGVYDLLPKF